MWALTHHSQGHHGTTCQKPSRSWHKHTRDTPFTRKAQHVSQCRYSPSIHWLPYLLSSTLLPYTPVVIVLNSCLVTSNHLSSASMAYYTYHVSLFQEKHCWSEEIFHSIDWLASDKEFKQDSTWRQVACLWLWWQQMTKVMILMNDGTRLIHKVR